MMGLIFTGVRALILIIAFSWLMSSCFGPGLRGSFLIDNKKLDLELFFEMRSACAVANPTRLGRDGRPNEVLVRAKHRTTNSKFITPSSLEDL